MLQHSVVTMGALTLAMTAAGELSRRDRIIVLAIRCTRPLLVVMDDRAGQP
jgi:hypothetical protein